MRVVQLCEAFSRSSETFIYDTVTELDRQGVDCHVLTMNRANEEERRYEKVHLAPWPEPWNLARLWRRALATLGIVGDVDTHKWPGLRARFRRHLERLDPDVVHAQFGPMGVLVAPLTEALDTPLIVTFHGYDISVLPQNKKTRRRYRILFKKADALIGVSKHNRDKLLALGAPEEKVRVLHNGTRIEDFTYSNPSTRFEGRKVKLLFVGRLVRVKSPVDLVDAVGMARNQMNGKVDLHLTIAGDGPESNSVRQQAQHRELQDQVDCLGRVSHDEVQRLMKRHHIYAQHSKKINSGAEEGLGVTFIEAQASGLPVVATRSGGIPDVVVDGETGYLVPERDVEAMANRIVYLARHPDKWGEMGRAGRRHVEENFNLTSQVEKLIEIYESVRRNTFAISGNCV
ncbi:glycosyltransferase family 4 protein [Salinibacter ruber]|uniref:glycosyltransferase family 4 protein n=1 Tax=Salinibacter ruber TaxID=146919 RepID=UPI002072D35B|nr:glycosyltransferase family 4 protein [Salinibacter ruber]